MDTKNLILAIAMSLAILLGWQTFVEQPQQAERQAELERQEQAAGRDPNTIGVPSVPPAAGTQAAVNAAPRRARSLCREACSAASSSMLACASPKVPERSACSPLTLA